MATSNSGAELINHVTPEQRLGNKSLFTSTVTKDGKQIRYFSGTDAEIYFGETYIDEVTQISFQLQQNTMPLFGYNSYVYDQVARGARLINGSFVINFTEASYLYKILDILTDIPLSSETSVIKDQENTLEEYDEVKKTSSSSTATRLSPSAVKPMWNKTFELVVSYGNAKEFAANSSMAILTGVVLTGCSQILNMSGEPIYETYSFVAQDINFTPLLSKTSTIKASVSKENVIVIKDMGYSEKIDSVTKKPYGIIGITYKTYAAIEKVMIELKIDTNKNKGMLTIPKNNMYNQDTIKYRVPDIWRNAVKQYCLKDPENPPNTMPVDLAFTYSSNGSSSTAILSSKARIIDVYSNL